MTSWWGRYRWWESGGFWISSVCKCPTCTKNMRILWNELIIAGGGQVHIP